VAADEFEVWPENWPSVALFTDCLTQWRIGMAGPTGLDYAGVNAVMEMRGIKSRKRRASLFDDVRVMEIAALDSFRGRK
jgi:hypothetical protein